MRYLLFTIWLLSVSTTAWGASGAAVTYTVAGQAYEGYFISPSDRAPFVLLIHDWDGLTDYEIKRANMLADLGYAVFALDQFAALAGELEAAGIAHEMITYGGAQHAFTVFGGKRYQAAADTNSWQRFTAFLAEVLR